MKDGKLCEDCLKLCCILTLNYRIFIYSLFCFLLSEVKYDTGNQKSGNLHDNSKPVSRKKEVLETTLVQAIKIKNDCPSIPSPDSKVMC